MNTDGILEYRIGHLRDRLAREDAAELGLLVEAHGTRAVLRGRVADEEARRAVLHAAGEELAGLDWYADLTVCQARPPGPGETEEVVT
ncbi:hypothetical protein WDV06_11330 [Streptomyces racemochromogenes]|uniref:BON domain-containing protein n=1 Tax=Streptomyces racemochromogenes TaxID=67353 RepID=A0ABW7PBF2_9ACTN